MSTKIHNFIKLINWQLKWQKCVNEEGDYNACLTLFQAHTLSNNVNTIISSKNINIECQTNYPKAIIAK